MSSTSQYKNCVASLAHTQKRFWREHTNSHTQTLGTVQHSGAHTLNPKFVLTVILSVWRGSTVGFAPKALTRCSTLSVRRVVQSTALCTDAVQCDNLPTLVYSFGSLRKWPHNLTNTHADSHSPRSYCVSLNRNCWSSAKTVCPC